MPYPAGGPLQQKRRDLIYELKDLISKVESTELREQLEEVASRIETESLARTWFPAMHIPDC